MLPLLCIITLCLSSVLADDPDIKATAQQLITNKGYPLEEHFVTTSDFYILRLIRIPNPGKPVAFLQHGVLDSFATWVMNYPQQSLAFILYDAGYDVWMGNSRGNAYSRNNTKHNPNCFIFNCQFWDYSWDDMAAIDVPTNVNYILSVTGNQKLAYIGHSQGTTQAFANFASANSIANKISVFVALAPVAYIQNTQSILIKTLAALDLDELLALLGVKEFLPQTKILDLLLPGVCKATPGLCANVIYLFAGLDQQDLNVTRLPVYVSHFPSGTSCMDMVHYAQGVRQGKFDYFDYGITNPIHYHGSLVPPLYNLSSITSPPIALFWGDKDDLSDPVDVKRMIFELPSSTVVFKQEVQDYAHLDFVWGENANSIIYGNVLTLLAKYQ